MRSSPPTTLTALLRPRKERCAIGVATALNADTNVTTDATRMNVTPLILTVDTIWLHKVIVRRLCLLPMSAQTSAQTLPTLEAPTPAPAVAFILRHGPTYSGNSNLNVNNPVRSV